MAKQELKAGTTSFKDTITITDVNGNPITGLVFNSTGLLAKYVFPGAAGVAITLATQTVTGAWSSGGFVEIDATAFPGLYRIDPPDAALAAGNTKVVISVYGYAGISANCRNEYLLQAVDNQDAVRGGLSSLPNANAGTNGGLPLSVDASGRVDVLKINGTSQTARDIGASVLLSSGTGTGQLDFTSGVVKSNLAQILGTALTETAGQIAAGFKKVFDVLTPVFTAASVNQTGDSFARIGTNGAGLTAVGDTSGTTTLLTRIASALTITTGKVDVNDKTGFALTSAYDLSKTAAQAGDQMALTAGAVTALVASIWAAGARTLTSFGTLVADVATAVWAAGSRTLTAFGFTVTTDVSSVIITNLDAPVSDAAVPGDAMSLTTGERDALIAQLLTSALDAESYANPGEVPTLSQALYMMLSEMGQFSISGTTITCKKLDGTTQSMTFTMNSSTAPTSRVRAA